MIKLIEISKIYRTSEIETIMIKLIEISKIYRTSEIETMALDNINLEVREGEFVSIMGPSGCGKSTLLNIAGLLDEPSSGTVELHGKPVSGLNAREAARFRNTELGFPSRASTPGRPPASATPSSDLSSRAST